MIKVETKGMLPSDFFKSTAASLRIALSEILPLNHERRGIGAPGDIELVKATDKKYWPEKVKA